MAYIQARAKFIQITAGSDGDVYALDEQGYAWYYWSDCPPKKAEWRQMNRRREGDAPIESEPT
jgi:hypothetical protein